jgi:DNA-binding NarL/FixJ family response regulator
MTAGRRVFAAPSRQGKALSRRERQVLALLAQGLTNTEISRRLGICYGTTVKHIRSIYDKLGVNNRVRAAAAAWRIWGEEGGPYPEG